MARTVAGLPEGTRITDFVSLGVISKVFPVETIREILTQTGRASRRQRDLPAHVMVYYVIALALYMQVSCREVLRCLTEGLRWLNLPGGDKPATINYGNFLQVTLDFLIIAFSVFLLVKLVNAMHRTEEKKPPEPSAQEKLLIEIRDLLKARQE